MLNEKLFFLIEEPNINFFTWSYHACGFNNVKHPLVGKYLPPISFVEVDSRGEGENIGKWACVKKHWYKTGKLVLEDIKKRKLIPSELQKKSEGTGKKLMKYCAMLEITDLNELSDEELIKHMEYLFTPSLELVSIGAVAVLSDHYHFTLSNELKRIIEGRIKSYSLTRKAQEYINILSSPISLSLVQKENIDLLKIAKLHKKAKDIEKEISEHHKKYCWIEYGYQGPCHDIVYFRDQVAEAVKKFKDLDEKINSIKESIKTTASLKKEFLNELKATDDERFVFDAASIFMEMKGYRMVVRHRVHFNCDKMLKILSERTKVKFDLLRAMSLSEVKEFVLHGNKPENVEKRLVHFGTLFKDGRFTFFYGDELSRFIEENIEKEEIKEVTRFHGQAACLGVVKGPAKIVNNVADIPKVNRGDILVSIQTNPDLVPAMEKAAGFITDTGGITCHAAIVAREMNKPCITGTKTATKVIKDGDIVEINAQHGTVRILEKAKE